MDISGKSVPPLSGSDRNGRSFADSLRKQDPAGATPPPILAKAASAGDLAAGLGSMSPDFIPALGEGMIDAVALGEGAVREMQRYEEETTDR